MSTWCVLLAAGRGTRSGLSRNKVFYRLNGRSILSRCIDAFADSGLYDGLVLVLSENEIDDYRKLTDSEGVNPIVREITVGGSERRISAFNGLKCVPEDCEIVSIHDAARPFVTGNIMAATIEDARRYGSGVISTPVTDTIKYLDPDTGKVTSPERSRLHAVQTPQTFRFQEIMRAHIDGLNASIIATDDAMLYEQTYGTVHLSESADAVSNKKFTNPGDFQKTMNAMRIGQGYDAHRLKEGRELWLCGVNVPHTKGLDGHSDADVSIHALMDAILGAMGEGDIGHRFPDNDPKYKGISSMLLLEDVVRFADEKGYHIVNADITIVAQKPKLAPFINRMRANMATAMHIDIECANVKATTTERMGFEGEETGISAQAVVLIEKSCSEGK